MGRPGAEAGGKRLSEGRKAGSTPMGGRGISHQYVP